VYSQVNEGLTEWVSRDLQASIFQAANITSCLEQGAMKGASMAAVFDAFIMMLLCLPASNCSRPHLPTWCSHHLCKPQDICVTYLPAWVMKVGRGGGEEHYAFLCEGEKSPGVRWGEVCFPVGSCVMGAEGINEVSISSKILTLLILSAPITQHPTGKHTSPH